MSDYKNIQFNNRQLQLIENAMQDLEYVRDAQFYSFALDDKEIQTLYHLLTKSINVLSDILDERDIYIFDTINVINVNEVLK